MPQPSEVNGPRPIAGAEYRGGSFGGERGQQNPQIEGVATRGRTTVLGEAPSVDLGRRRRRKDSPAKAARPLIPAPRTHGEDLPREPQADDKLAYPTTAQLTSDSQAEVDEGVAQWFRTDNDSAVRYGARVASNFHSGEDAVQDAWERILKTARERGITADNLHSYLLTSVTRQGIDRNRRKKRRPEDPVSPMPTLRDHGGTGIESSVLEQRGNAAPSAEDVALGGNDRAEIEEAVDRIPEPFREALLLAADGHTYEEIGEMTSIKLGTVRSRISRARGYAKTPVEDTAPNQTRNYQAEMQGLLESTPNMSARQLAEAMGISVRVAESKLAPQVRTGRVVPTVTEPSVYYAFTDQAKAALAETGTTAGDGSKRLPNRGEIEQILAGRELISSADILRLMENKVSAATVARVLRSLEEDSAVDRVVIPKTVLYRLTEEVDPSIPAQPEGDLISQKVRQRMERTAKLVAEGKVKLEDIARSLGTDIASARKLVFGNGDQSQLQAER